MLSVIGIHYISLEQSSEFLGLVRDLRQFLPILLS
jgi:hypothetical protein